MSHENIFQLSATKHIKCGIAFITFILFYIYNKIEVMKAMISCVEYDFMCERIVYYILLVSLAS